MKIHLIDECCGTGKSHWILEKMRGWKRECRYEQFVYISPLLTEVGGHIVDGVETGGRVQEDVPDLEFHYPTKVMGSKLQDVRRLVRSGKNIAATHALFRLMDDSSMEILKETSNILVIDEAVNAIEHFDKVSSQGLKTLLKGGQLIRKESGQLQWNHKDYPISGSMDGDKRFEYHDLVDVCDSGYAYITHDVNDNTKQVVILWQFPKELLECFTDVYVLTYLFEGSVMSNWAEINKVEVVRVRPELYKSTREVKEDLKGRIKVYETKALKKVGGYSLSQSFWKGASDEEVKEISATVSSLFNNYIYSQGVRVGDVLVTCPKNKWYREDADKVNAKSDILLGGKGYTKADWIPSNCKATNLFKDKTCMIYFLNKYPQSYVANMCHGMGSPIDKDKFAMAEAIQAIFRTCIRKGDDSILHLVLVSNRMRKLFKDWLNSEGVFEED